MFSMYDCSECKEHKKELEEYRSRYNHLYFAQEDYDRVKGKGAFKRKYPASVKLMNELLDKKTELELAHAKHEYREDKEDKEEEVAETKAVAGIEVM